MSKLKHLSRGDTLIEVMIAMTLFSMVAIGAMIVMNRGLSLAQRSLEITLARQQIDAQAEMLRYVHQKFKEDDGPYTVVWDSLDKITSPVQLVGVESCPTSLPSGGFSLASSAGGIDKVVNYSSNPATYARMVGTEAQGISTQLVRVQGGAAYDAYIQACWYSVGGDRPVTIGTIVRLYDSEA